MAIGDNRLCLGSRHLLVVEEDGVPVGLVSVRDVIRHHAAVRERAVSPARRHFFPPGVNDLSTWTLSPLLSCVTIFTMPATGACQ